MPRSYRKYSYKSKSGKRVRCTPRRLHKSGKGLEHAVYVNRKRICEKRPCSSGRVKVTKYHRDANGHQVIEKTKLLRMKRSRKCRRSSSHKKH